MSKTAGVDVVHSLDELLGVVTDDLLVEWTRVSHVVKKLSTMNQLANNVSDLDLFTIFLVPDGVLVEFKIFDNVLVVESLD